MDLAWLTRVTKFIRDVTEAVRDVTEAASLARMRQVKTRQEGEKLFLLAHAGEKELRKRQGFFSIKDVLLL
jgi:hypothetical protein